MRGHRAQRGYSARIDHASGIQVRPLVWNQRHLMIVLREYDFCNRHRPYRTLNQAAPLRPLPDGTVRMARENPLWGYRW